MSEPRTGGCLCGAVRFAVAGPLGGEAGTITVCHCAMCRLAGGLGVAVVPTTAAGFEVTAGAELVREYESSPGKRRAFCSNCGAGLYSRRDDRPDALRLRLGALDSSADLRIGAHIHTERAPAWSLGDDAPRYPGVEPGRR